MPSQPPKEIISKKAKRMPDTYILIFLVVVLAAVITYLVPVGTFETQEVTYKDASGNQATKTVIVPGSYEMERDAAGNPVKKGVPIFAEKGNTGLFNYVFEGLVSGDKWGSAVGIVALILIIGGAFSIVLDTGAVEAGILAVITKTQKTEKILVPLIFFIFSLGGATFGMGEEAIAFAMIIVPLVIALGYDSITGVFISYVATQIGFAIGPMNPFSVMIAQGIAGIPVFSGALFRWIMWFVFSSMGCIFIVLYSRRIKKNPLKSIAYSSDNFFRRHYQNQNISQQKFNTGHLLVLLTIFGTIVWLIWGVTARGYFIPEIATQFFIMGITAGIIGVIFRLNDMKINDIASSFRKGAQDLLSAALIVGMAKGILLVLGGDSPDTPNVLNTILHSTGKALATLPKFFSAWFMYIFQAVFNFFVISSSGQAALTMPLLSPLADIAGITRQTAVLAFQLGDGFTNLIFPTSAALMGTLGVARLDWLKWVKFQIKFQAILFFLATFFIFLAVAIGYA
ncbi:MAG: putative basic amino acid antiporter YfcC [Candidatus Aminicenantes bacterium]|nr:putative basic amino acid antiporter YfcC [Candidatus Aminicenantes bacterium]